MTWIMAEKKGSFFLNVVSIIGAILVLVGIAWIIAYNWHSIPDFLKVSILVFATLLAFVVGVLVRTQEHEYVARALIFLGGGMYVLSVFLISQIYSTITTLQDWTWLFLFCWVFLIFIAYVLNSPENLLGGIVLFFPWLIMQYMVTVEDTIRDSGAMVIIFVFIFLTMGLLLYGLNIFHKAIKHPFANLYRFWTVFYFFVIFYLLSFQSIQPLLGAYEFDASAFSLFLILFIVVSYAIFIFSILFAASKRELDIREIMIFIGVFILLFILVLFTKSAAGAIGACSPTQCYNFEKLAECNSAPANFNCEWIVRDNGVGYCEIKNCYNYDTESLCNAALSTLGCEWQSQNNAKGYCQEFDCYNLNESSCNSAPSGAKCNWVGGRCEREYKEIAADSLYDTCRTHNNQKDSCLSETGCSWGTGGYIESIVGRDNLMPFGVWVLWLIINVFFIGFIILILWYGQFVGSTKIINLGLIAFILEIISRYIGFWMNFSGYLAFSILAILGGMILILGAWLIPKWRKNLIIEAQQEI
ncbi:MAG: DUF2157 domain-containing protein [Nanoarchaeota archaeon]